MEDGAQGRRSEEKSDWAGGRRWQVLEVVARAEAHGRAPVASPPRPAGKQSVTGQPGAGWRRKFSLVAKNLEVSGSALTLVAGKSGATVQMTDTITAIAGGQQRKCEYDGFS